MNVYLRHGRHHLLQVKHIANPLSGPGLVSRPEDKLVFRCKPLELGAKGVEKKVYFVRHGQSVSNVARDANPPDPDVDTHPRYTDAPLTLRGVQQASALQGIVDNWNVQLVVCSPLTRAIQTACHVFQNTSAPIRADPLVMEYYGNLIECKGRDKALLEGDETLRRLKRFGNVCLNQLTPNWCDIVDDMERPVRFLDKLATCPEERVCVVAHYGTINIFALNEPSNYDLETQRFAFPFLRNCDVIETTWLLRPDSPTAPRDE